MQSQHKKKEHSQDGVPQKNPRRWAKPVLAGALIATASIVCWVAWGQNASKTSASQNAPLVEVKVSKPLVETVGTRLGFLGQFSAINSVELRAQVGGTLTSIDFKDGDIVQKGELLFTIDSRPYDIRLAQAEAELENAAAKTVLANSEYLRAIALEKNSAGTVQNVEQRRSELRVSQALVAQAKTEVDDARLDVDRCKIFAPFTGRIGIHQVSVGNLVAGSRAAASPTTLLTTLVSLNPIYLDFDMGESDYLAYSSNRGKTGSKTHDVVELALSNEKEFARKGALEVVNNVIDRSSGTIRARATVDNPDVELIPGEFARLRLVVGKPLPTLMVPDAAVLPDQSEHMVLTVNAHGFVVPKQVQVGALRDGLRIVKSGLTADDDVITEGIPYAIPGAKVIAKASSIQADKHDAKD